MLFDFLDESPNFSHYRKDYSYTMKRVNKTPCQSKKTMTQKDRFLYLVKGKRGGVQKWKETYLERIKYDDNDKHKIGKKYTICFSIKHIKLTNVCVYK